MPLFPRMFLESCPFCVALAVCLLPWARTSCFICSPFEQVALTARMTSKLFRKRTETSEKTNLYIFLTPRVIKSPMEAQEILKDKQGQMGTVKEGGIKLYEQNAPLKE